MKNIINIKDCYGCGVCALACGKKIINIQQNNKGFYQPIISPIESCTECGLCLIVCSFYNAGLAIETTPLRSYAAWSRDSSVLRKCSSGGIGYEIGRELLQQNYKICGVRYNVEMNRAEHYIASSENELLQSIGSKYIQSYTKNGFEKIDRKNKHLVIGTPCQIDSFRRYITKFKISENFVLMDFFCHGVPSMLAWKHYLKIVEKNVGKVSNVSWRNKFSGWHDSWAMHIEGDQHGKKVTIDSRLSQGDIFYKLFLGDYCCNSACQKKCKFKYAASSADIRIGDLWGNTYKNNENGVSALICFTDKGIAIVEKLEKKCHVEKQPFEIVAEGQMKQNAGKAYTAYLVNLLLKSDRFYGETIWKLIFIVERALRLPENIIKKIFK